MAKKKGASKLKVIKPSRLIILIVLIASNTLAWFIYATKVDSSVSVHVKGWNVLFEDGQSQITNQINIVVDDLYPGMEDYTYSISAYNNSEVAATFSYKILEARVLNTTYVTQEGRAENGQQVQQGDLTSAQLESKLLNDYPFSIEISVSNAVIAMANGEESFSLEASWPYESNNDAADTQWGIDAYSFKTNNPTLPSIALTIKLTVTQSTS